MEDLLQSQIQDSCRLALPNGLKELMCDISREVLRAQPPNLLQFITDYLSSLLISRENLYIATQVCNAVCACDCRPELEDELRLSLDESLVKDVAKIIEKHIGKGQVSEGNFLMKLISKTSIEERHLPAVLAAVRNAFLRYQRNHTQQVRAHKVKHETDTAIINQLPNSQSPSGSIYSSPEVIEAQVVESKEVKSTEASEKTKVTFGSIDRAKISDMDTCGSEQSKTDGLPHKAFPPMARLSSTSLAGSYLSLPKYRPYSSHDFDTLEESPEKERSNFDYTREISDEQEDITTITKENERKQTNILLELSKDVSDEESESIEDNDSIEADNMLVATSAIEIDKINVLDEVIEENIRNPEVDVLESDEVDEDIEEIILIEDKNELLGDQENLIPAEVDEFVPDEADKNIEETGIGEGEEDLENHVNKDIIQYNTKYNDMVDESEENIMVDAVHDRID